MYCWVNKGAKGIALIDEKSSYTRLKYVFDISDVHKARRIGRFPNLWEMKEEHQEVVLERLEKTYGETNQEADFADRIIEIANRIAIDCYKEIALDLEYIKEGSFLEELDAYNIQVRLRDTLASSIAYTILKRCGITESELNELIDFPYIHEFNTVDTLSQLESNVSNFAKPILMEIGKAIRVYDRALQRQTSSLEKNFVKKELENTPQIDYNTLKRESGEGDKQSKIPTGDSKERGNYDESEIREKRGLPDTDVTDGRAARGNTNKIRTDEREVSERTQGRDLHRTSSERKTEGASTDHTGRSRTENGAFDRTDESESRSDRTTQGKGPNAVGAEDEQHSTRSRRNRTEGTDLQLNSARQEPGEENLPGSSFVDLGEKDNKPENTYQQLNLFSGNPEELKKEVITEKIAKPEAINFHIDYKESETFNKGFAPKEKFSQNIEAIRTLKIIESENRIATPEEQKILAKYVGWGGLADAFDKTKDNWTKEYQELKSLLSEEEYISARESTLNAHYTNPIIIKSIYDAIGHMGFTKGNILEPAMGTGNFFGMLPETMQQSKLYGVELDELTGRIARQLYPLADIKINGFEKTSYPNDFFDVAVGNVPFGQYKVADRAYDRYNFLIHDYFFAKTLDQVRTGGIVAFITSKGTMDKQNPMVRKYLAQRAELLGAIRLPNTAFKENAGTEVTSDILFLKKRDRVIDIEPEWVHLSENEDGICMNTYFTEHPEMILGKMEMVSGPYGMETTCMPDTSIPLSEQLAYAISYIEGRIDEIEIEELEEDLIREILPASPDVKNYSYTIIDERVYYREDSIMRPVEASEIIENRIKGMIQIRNCTQELINFQLNEHSDSAIQEKQEELNRLYDIFSKKYGLISSKANKRAFNQDSSYCLLCSLEKLDEEGNFLGKADMFHKRTIKKQEVITSADTASEALLVSLSEKAKIDLTYMSELTGKSEKDITKELCGVIFQNPVTGKWETADEYLSGNVREKLATAKTFAENHPEYTINVSYLENVQPKELDASEIEVRIGATWLDARYMEDFIKDTFETPEYLFTHKIVGIQYSSVSGQWNVKGKNADHGNTLVNMTYGTNRANAYRILEDSLNLRDTRIFDLVTDDEGRERRILNKKETILVSQKQEAIREAFKDWIFRDPERRQALCNKYNQLFNSTRPREFDGSHLKFPGMTPNISLRQHQLNAVAHQLYGNNTLLAHCVGAGKTFEMIAAAMESKRLGLCQKSLFVVPNHLTEQWASDFFRLYPGANILASTKKDFEPANRKKFCSRIATGDYDAVIIGQSQFEKIPLSTERQVAMIERQMEEIKEAIEITKAANGEQYTIKQMEKTRKSLSVKLNRLNDNSRKDNVVTFEQLGVD